ncbi:hypothetical protein [Cohnella yongneupensis]|uniref:Uncharacterized protein n=1 Tax=Cohnella yongneupensis TaxID=425006 RepID=A0ABW0QXL4_9BACL
MSFKLPRTNRTGAMGVFSGKKLVVLLTAVIVIGVSFAVYFSMDARLHFQDINKQLRMDGIRLDMPEQDVIDRWGQGTNQEGFGGHFRTYEDHKVELGFSDDSESSCYRSVCNIVSSNADYSIYDIKIQDDIASSEMQLWERGFKSVENHLYRQDEFYISLQGDSIVEKIQVWFSDKDLQDREY